MAAVDGDIFPIKEALGKYMTRWYNGLYGDTTAVTSFKSRGIQKSIIMVPGRMVDSVESMIASYRKNNNDAAKGANSLMPVVFVCMAKDYIPTGGDFGGRQVGRRMIKLSDQVGASIYGYRQAMGDVRTQIAIVAQNEPTARSLAAQMGLFFGEIPNRRFYTDHIFGQYTVNMPVMLESPDVIFQSMQEEIEKLTILVADITLKVTIPYFDYPTGDDPNDGTSNNPPGYPSVSIVVGDNQNLLSELKVTEDSTVFGKKGDFDEPT